MENLILTAPLSMNAIWICIGVGVVIGLIAVLVMKSQLRSVRFKSGAGEYMKHDSFQLTAARDIFLYRTVTRVERPQNNNNK